MCFRYDEGMLSRLALGGGLLLVLSTTVAQADTSLIATGSASTGYSTNIQGVPENDDPTLGQQVEADGFSDLAPGLSAAYEHRRGIHNLSYIFGARLFFQNSEANSYNNTVIYQNILTVSPRGSLRMGASFNSGRVNAFDQAASQVVNQGNVLPDGDVEFISYNANIAYRHQLSQNWTGEASLLGGKFVPTGGGDQAGDTTNVEQRLRLDRGFRRHLVGVDFRTAFNKQIVPDVQKTLSVGPGINWTWNLSESFSTNSSAGVDVIGEYPTLARSLKVPRAAAAITYSHERGRATLGWARGVATNLFGGDTTINNQYSLTVGLPLPTKRPMNVGVDAAYATGEIIDIASDESRGNTERKSADLNLGMELTRTWILGLRFQVSKQTQDNILVDMSVDTAITNQAQGLLVLQGRFPGAAAAQVPPRSTDRVESGEADFGGGGTGASGAGAGGQQGGGPR